MRVAAKKHVATESISEVSMHPAIRMRFTVCSVFDCASCYLSDFSKVDKREQMLFLHWQNCFFMLKCNENRRILNTNLCQNVEFGALQKCANLVDLQKGFKRIFSRKSRLRYNGERALEHAATFGTICEPW